MIEESQGTPKSLRPKDPLLTFGLSDDFIACVREAQGHSGRKLLNDYQWDFLISRVRFPALVAGWASGKRIDINEWVKVKGGWKRMGEIVAGDIVYGFDGQETVVAMAHPIERVPVAYRLGFDTGEFIVADPEHLWYTVSTRDVATCRKQKYNTMSERAAGYVRTTQQIVDTLRTPNDYENNHRIPLALPFVAAEQPLPIAPYTFGAWLGDGSSRTSDICTEDPEVLCHIEADGYKTHKVPSQKNIYHIANGARSAKETLTGILRKIGVWRDKHIPENYLNASVAQRQELLRGLMDTDGYPGTAKQATCEYVSVNERLAAGVFELALGLGLKATLRMGDATLNGRFISKKYRICFSTREKVFKLSRKQDVLDRATSSMKQRYASRWLCSAEIVHDVWMRCLTVDAPDGLFLVSRSFIATHNTMMALMRSCVLSEAYENNLGLVVRKTFSDLRDCYDDQTDILTDTGWKRFADLCYADKVLSLDNQGVASYQAIKRIIKQSYRGVMKCHEKCNINFCITPNHQVYIARPSGKNGHKAKTAFELVRWDAIPQQAVFFKKDFIWSGREFDHFTFPARTTRCKGLTVSADDWFEFLGWYLSEGSVRIYPERGTCHISLSQSESVHSEQYQEIASVCRRLGVGVSEVQDKIVFANDAIGKHLREHCGHQQPYRRIPQYLREASSRQIRIFLAAFMKGDGYRFGATTRYNTASRELANGLQELIVKAGSYANMHIRDNRGRRSWIGDRAIVTKHLDYLLIEQSHDHVSFDSIVLSKDVKDVEYDGYIYCVETEPYHTVYVRRKGTCYWSGNSTLKDMRQYTESYPGIHIPNSPPVDVKIPQSRSIIMFRHLEELLGGQTRKQIQNVNLGWAYIEQAEEFETAEQFEMIRGRLRRKLKPNRRYFDFQRRKRQMLSTAKTCLGCQSANLREENGVVVCLDCSQVWLRTPDQRYVDFLEYLEHNELRTAFTIANANGKNWVWRQWLSPNRPNQDEFVGIEATSFDNEHNIAPDVMADWRSMANGTEMQKRKYRRFVINSHDEIDLEGTYYLSLMQEARKGGRIGSFAPDRSAATHTVWDLGASKSGSDTTAIWFFQKLGKDVRCIHYYEGVSEGIEHYVRHVDEVGRRMGLHYGKHFWPHDGKKLILATGKEQWQTAADMGLKVTILNKEKDVGEGIERVRKLLPYCQFDEVECALGIECLEAYRRRKNYAMSTEEKAVYLDHPVHDSASHGADGFRYLSAAVRKLGVGTALSEEEIRQMISKYS